MDNKDFVKVCHRGVEFMVNRCGEVKAYKASIGEWSLCNHFLNHDKYPVVSAYNPNIKRSISVGVHILVAKAFIPNPYGLPEVNHKDFDRSNYSIDNLEWCTHRNNVLYSRKADRYPALYGEANPNYGNRKLSQYYSQNKDVAKVKQGRPMGQNGRAKKCMLLCLNTGITIEFSCQREAYKFLVDNNTITPQKYPETYIKKLRKEQGYRGYKIIIE